MKNKIINIFVSVYSKIPVTKNYRLNKIDLMLESIGLDNIKNLVTYDMDNSTRTITDIKNSEIKEKIDFFTSTLEKNFRKEDLHNLYYNKEWITIVVRKHYLMNLFTQYTLEGQYDCLLNKMYLYGKNYIYSIYHEFFHLASTNSDSKNSSSGFSLHFDEYMIGEALNEGYTQLLTERYFDNDDEYTYFFEKKMAQNLELIIGQKKMESLYLNANFFGLISELKNYYNLDEIEKFLVSMDVIQKYSNKEIKSKEEIIKINKIIEDIICFFIKGYCINKSKLVKFTENDKQDLINFLKNINIKYEKEKCSYRFNMNKINNIIEKYLGNFAKLDLDILNRKKACYNR